MIGHAGDDTLEGGAGDDELRGGAGSDAYRFGRGDGNDIIIEDSWNFSDIDRIEMKAGIAPEDVRLTRVRDGDNWWNVDDLLLTIIDTAETITVRKHFVAGPRHAVEEIVFADGTVWNQDEIRRQVLIGAAGDDVILGFTGRDDLIVGDAGDDWLIGLSGNDTLLGGTGNDVLDGGAGNDRLYGGEGNDVLHGREGDDFLSGGLGDDILYGNEGNDTLGGGDGNDRLYGGEGDDVLDGGTGDDILDGGPGNDIYRFGRGYGNDVAIEAPSRITLGNWVHLDASLSPLDIMIRKQASDLVLDLRDSGDSLTLRWAAHYSEGSAFAGVRFADGTVWNYETLIEQSSIGTQGDDRIEGFEGRSQVFIGGTGNDTIIGGTGGDVFLFARGDGHDLIIDHDPDPENQDVILLGEGILPEEVTLTRARSDLVIQIADGEDSVTVSNFFRWSQGAWAHRIELLEFADGSSWDADELARRAVLAETSGHLVGTPGPDVLVGNDAGNLIDGREGDDLIYGGSGDDILIGGYGSDMLYGGEGNDVLYGFLRETDFDEDNDYLTTTAAYYLYDAGNWLVNDLSSNYHGFGDHFLSRNDDGSTSAIDIQSIFGPQGLNFFGRSHTSLYVNNNGNITLGASLSAYTPSRIEGGPRAIIAPFWGDVDTRSAWGATATPGGNSTGSNLVYYHLDSENGVFTATWDDVGYYNQKTDKLNAFQVQLVSRGGGDFDIIYRYEAINWTAGDASGGFRGLGGTAARAGYSAGTSNPEHYYELTGSGDESAMLLLDSTPGNTGRNGVWVFNIRNGTPVSNNRELILAGDSGVNFLYGGPGDDVFFVDSIHDVVIEYEDEGIDHVHASVSFILPDHVENLTLTGLRHIDAQGNELNNHIVGNVGDNVLYGGDGDDFLYGGAGNDSLFGGAGADTLRGGSGQDYLFGGEGGDTYLYETGDELVVIEDGHGDTGFIPGAPNVLIFGAGISLTMLRFFERDGDLVIQFDGIPEDEVILRDYDANRATLTRSVDIIRFADGSEISSLSVADHSGNDLLNDLHGTLLVGGEGSDTYVIHRNGETGPLETTIVEIWNEQDINRLILSGDIDPQVLQLSVHDSDLLLSLGEASGSVRFAGFDPHVPGMQAPFSHIMLDDSGATLSFEEFLARGITGLADNNERTVLDVDIGDGLVTVPAGDNTVAIDSIRFGSGISLESLQTRLSFADDGGGGYWLLLSYGGEGDILRLSGFLRDDVLGGERSVEHFLFADAAVVDYAELVSWGFTLEGYENATTMYGSNLDDRLFGSDGDDVLVGGDGNDELIGGRGDDTLIGGAGDDAYVFSRGDGVDTIIDSGDQDFNYIRFAAGIASDQVFHDWDGSTLLLHYGSGDTIRIERFYSGATGNPAILALAFEDGTVESVLSRLNQAPIATGDLVEAVAERGVDFVYVVPEGFFEDADRHDELRFSARLSDGRDLPAWLSFDRINQRFSGTPRLSDVGTLNVVVEARDHFGLFVESSFELGVELRNESPMASAAIADMAVIRNKAFELSLPRNTFVDPDADDQLTLTSSLADGTALPDWLTFNPAAETFSGTPSVVGDYVLRVVATDLVGATAEQHFTLSVEAADETSLTDRPQAELDTLKSAGSFSPQPYAQAKSNENRSVGADRLDASRPHESVAWEPDQGDTSRSQWSGWFDRVDRLKPQPAAEAQFEQQWIRVRRALAELESERLATGDWTSARYGADTDSLAGLMSRVRKPVDVFDGSVGLLSNASHLRGFNGIRDGMSKLSWPNSL